MYTIQPLIHGLIVKRNNFLIHTDVYRQSQTQTQIHRRVVCKSKWSKRKDKQWGCPVCVVRFLLHTMLPCRCFYLINKFSSFLSLLFSSSSSSSLLHCRDHFFYFLCISCILVDNDQVESRRMFFSPHLFRRRKLLAHGGLSVERTELDRGRDRKVVGRGGVDAESVDHSEWMAISES